MRGGTGQGTFRRALGPFDAAMVVVGGIVGAGIFINPAIVAQRLASGPLVLAAWAAGGAIAVAGALAYAELGALFPRVGGQYAYLRDAFHPLVGFLYGWALLAIIETGGIAAVAMTFGQYALRLVGRAGGDPRPLAVGAIAILTVVNWLGVKPGSRVLNVFVVLKVLAIAVLIFAGLLLPVPAAAAHAAGAAAAGTAAPAAGGTGLLAFGTALVPILFAYGGWQNANYIAEEVERPRRNLPLALLGGTAVVVVIYLSINVAYLRILGRDGLAGTLAPAAECASRLFGPLGERFVAAAIAISTFGFLDLAILAPSRVYYAMAADGAFPPLLARLSPRHGVPTTAIAVQSLWAIALALSGTFGQLLDYVVFADQIFFALTVAALFVFRVRVPLAARDAGTFRTPGYPLVPALFVIAACVTVLSVVLSNPKQSAIGAAILALGWPVYWYSRSRGPSPARSPR